MRTLQRGIRLGLVLVVASAVFADYWEYSKAFHASPAMWMDVVHGTAAAPQQYRIGVVFLAGFLQRHGHLGLRYGFTLIDLTSISLSVYLLLRLFEGTAAFRSSSAVARTAGLLSFAFLAQYYLSWLTWYQKPETAVSIAMLACTLWLLTAKPVPSSRTGQLGAAAAMLALAALQAFVRADVAVSAHLGILLVCSTREVRGFALRRDLQIATSGLAVLTAGGIQYLLSHVVYPHASYGSTPIFQLLLNLSDWRGYLPFVLLMAPWAWTLANLRKTGPSHSEPMDALAAGSILFLCLWVIIGRIEEVRIFLPYAIVLVPLTSFVVLGKVVQDEVRPLGTV